MAEEKKFAGTMKDLSPYLTLGLQLAITVVIFFFLGKYADAYFGTKPWLMVAAILLGAAGGLIKFFTTVIALGKKEEREQHTKI